MSDEKEGGVAAAEPSAGQEKGVLEDAVGKVRSQREDKVPFTVVEEENLPKARRKVVAEVPWEEFDRRVGELFKDVQSTATIEGFRKGKAPLALLKRRYLPAAKNETIEKMTPPIVREYESSKSLTLYGVPSITDYKAEDGQAVRITIEVEVKPEIEPKNYTGLEVEVVENQYDPAAVDEQIERMRSQNSSWELVEREFKAEDAVVLDVKAVDQKGHTVIKETDKLYPGGYGVSQEVTEKLIGKKAGDSFETEAKTQTGKLKYSVAVKGVKELKRPEIDDEFAKDTGFESLKALRSSIEERLKKHADTLNTDSAFDALTEKLVQAHEFEVPAALKAHVEQEIARNDYYFMQRTGLTPPRLRGLTNRSQYKEELDRAAEARVKGFLLIDAIGLKEQIVATDADIDAALEARAKEEGRKPVAIRAALEKRREWNQFIEQVRFDKIRDSLLAKNKIKLVAPKAEAEAEGAAEGEEQPKAKAKAKAKKE